MRLGKTGLGAIIGMWVGVGICSFNDQGPALATVALLATIATLFIVAKS